MFENVINQDAVDQIKSDIEHNALAPSILFSGPVSSGKGSAALELMRVLSCQGENADLRLRAPWNCECRECKQHRLLSHPDMIMMGGRNFSAEIAASADTFLRNRESAASRFLLIRSVQKLLVRFNPILWEDDTKINKLNEAIIKLTEDLDDFQRLAEDHPGEEKDKAVIEKLISSIITKSNKLENDGVANIIPVAQIRRASLWSRLAPSGKRKVLLIEQADTMQDASANSLLKILEEPPENLSIILTTSYPGAILPTLLSRLRPYRFLQRDEQTEREVIRRVFRAESFDAGKKSGSRITAYLDSFLPSQKNELYPAAAFFAASIAASAVLNLRRSGVNTIPECLLSLGKYSAPISESLGFGRPSTDTKTIISSVMKSGNNFEVRSLFSVFLINLMEIISGLLIESGKVPGLSTLASVFGKKIQETEMGVSTFNQNPTSALERLFIELKEILGSETMKEFS